MRAACARADSAARGARACQCAGAAQCQWPPYALQRPEGEARAGLVCIVGTLTADLMDACVISRGMGVVMGMTPKKRFSASGWPPCNGVLRCHGTRHSLAACLQMTVQEQNTLQEQ